MKVGTDGVLLGALATGGKKVLDIGTGTGLCALMLAQRCPDAMITAIDIDKDACSQAVENVSESPFRGRIEVVHASLENYAKTADNQYDAIISNPPFFEEDLACPDDQRDKARHATSLPFSALIKCSKSLLADDGILTLILPTTALSRIESECAYASMFIVRKIYIRTTEKKAPKRVVIYIRRHPAPIESETQTLMVKGVQGGQGVQGKNNSSLFTIHSSLSERSPWYEALTETFYLPHSPSGEHA
jgi:tRNA1Val (adenine37-N6)-methyltransferase